MLTAEDGPRGCVAGTRLPGGEEEYKYECGKSQCYYTGHTWMPTTAIRLIEKLSGRSYLSCKKAEEGQVRMSCIFYRAWPPNRAPLLACVRRGTDPTPRDRDQRRRGDWRAH